MYIRRKVFSLLQDEDGEERYLSTTEYELEQRQFNSAVTKVLRNAEALAKSGAKIPDQVLEFVGDKSQRTVKNAKRINNTFFKGKRINHSNDGPLEKIIKLWIFGTHLKK